MRNWNQQTAAWNSPQMVQYGEPPWARQASKEPPSYMPKPGQTFGGYLTIEKLIGQGGYGCVYKAIRQGLGSTGAVAVKVQKESENAHHVRQSHNVELDLLLSMQDRSYHVVRLLYHGFDNDRRLKFLVLQYLDKTIKHHRKQRPGDAFSPSTAARVGMQIVEALRDLHENGWVYRDVKASNFLTGFPPNHRRIYTIDFGLSRRFVDASGNLLPQRQKAGFCGTLKYASLHTLRGQDQGPRDDLISCSYLIMELFGVVLPWRHCIEFEPVVNMKGTIPIEDLAMGLPSQIRCFYKNVVSLEYQDVPNYNHLLALLASILGPHSAERMDDPYDWEMDASSSSSAEIGPQDSEPTILRVSQKASSSLSSRGMDNGSTEAQSLI